MADLNARQLRFVQEYLVDLNATQAAIRAGYSKKTAAEMGAENLRKPHIAQAIADAQYKRATKTETDAAFILKRLAEEVTADIADLYDDTGCIRPIKEWPLIWRQGLVSSVKVAEEGDGVVVREIKLSDRIKRLELLGKHISVNAFREQVGHGDPEGNPLPAPVVDEMSKNDIARRVAFLLAQGLHSAAK